MVFSQNSPFLLQLKIVLLIATSHLLFSMPTTKNQEARVQPLKGNGTKNYQKKEIGWSTNVYVYVH
jgi:hypothetical protein